MNKFVIRLEKYLGSFLLRIINFTIRKEYLGLYPEEPTIFMIWHRDQIPAILLNMNRNVGVLVSQSKDGELIAGPISTLGYVPVRGSSTRGGTQALRGLLTHLKNNSVVLTPDGPKGPIYNIKDGLLTTAYLSKRAIVPVAVDVSCEWIFNSWDRFRFPKPFSKIRLKYGKEVYVENKEDFTQVKKVIQEEMEELYNSIRFKK